MWFVVWRDGSIAARNGGGKDSKAVEKNVCLLPWPLHPATNTLKS
jgi:hypothetical protein